MLGILNKSKGVGNVGVESTVGVDQGEHLDIITGS